MTREDKILKLCKVIMCEGSKTCGDYHRIDWNPHAHAEITITIEEIRMAHSIYYGSKMIKRPKILDKK